MMETDGINKTLEFLIFCIENVARRLDRNPAEVYELLTDQSDVLKNYIIPGYDVLHTQDKEYIVDDILSVLKKKGVVLP